MSQGSAPDRSMHSDDDKSISSRLFWQSILSVIGIVIGCMYLLLEFEFAKYCGSANSGRVVTQAVPAAIPAEHQPAQLYVQSNRLTMVQARTNILHIDGRGALTGYSDGFQNPGAAITADHHGPAVGVPLSDEPDTDISEENFEEE